MTHGRSRTSRVEVAVGPLEAFFEADLLAARRLERRPFRAFAHPGRLRRT